LASDTANNDYPGNDEQHSWRLEIIIYNHHTEKSIYRAIYSIRSVQGVYNVEIWIWSAPKWPQARWRRVRADTRIQHLEVAKDYIVSGIDSIVKEVFI
jgi:hypothetical protein